MRVLHGERRISDSKMENTLARLLRQAPTLFVNFLHIVLSTQLNNPKVVVVAWKDELARGTDSFCESPSSCL